MEADVIRSTTGNRLRKAVTWLFTVSLLAGVRGTSGGEHQLFDEFELTHKATDVTHTPNWYQFRIDRYHPIGCGPLAWTMLYAYWYSFSAKDKLFDVTPPDASSSGAEDPEVTRPANELSATTETTHGQAGSSVYGRTWTHDMCKGIEYAKKRGYTESRCLKITGTEFAKFERIKEYIRTNRPVILNINHEGLGILDHYVIVEGVRKRKERVAGSWRDRDVEYLVNFGWGQKEGSKWISVRQVGANTSTVYTSGAAFLVDVSGTPLPEAASANEAICKDWCERNKPECSMCSHLPGCTPGYAPIKSWRGTGRDWFACKKRDSRRSDASEGNREDCEKWCTDHRDDKGCVKCDTRLGCGDGYIHLETFAGYGNNWHACRKEGKSDREKASEKNHADCLSWCDANQPQCVECSKLPDCGVGLKRLESWTGFGDNWFACGKNAWGEASEENKTECETWCKAHEPLCVGCSGSVGCGQHKTSMKMFGGEGKNWYACRKADSQSNKDACELWCNDHKPECEFCSTKDYCGYRYERMELFRGPGENWAACRRK
jgi:hypothetical protein